MKVGMIRHKCPVCGEYIFSHSWDTDQVHKCVENDHVTRMTTRTEFEKIPSRINIKFDKDYFINLGLNPYPKLRKEKEKRESCFEATNVDTFIDFEDLEEA